MANAELSNYLSNLVGVIEPLAKQVNLAYWHAATTGSAEAFERFTELQLRLQKVFADADDFERIRRWRDDPRVPDPLGRRQVELLYNDFLRNQVDPSLNEEITRLSARIENQFNIYRATLDGRTVTTNDISEILRRSRDVELRRKAWEAGKHVGAVVHADLLRLVRMRNEAARSLGYDDFYGMSLDLDEQNESDLEELFTELEESTRDPFAALKDELDGRVAMRYGIERHGLRPWHYDDLFFQEAPRVYEVDLDEFYRGKDVIDLVRRFFGDLGLEVDDILQRSDLHERAGKDQHAFCADIDRRGDIRILANVKNDEMWAGTMLHELGHAVYDKYIDPGLPFTLRKHAHTFVTEAVAMMFGRLSKNPAWISAAVGLPEGRASAAMRELSRYLPLAQLVFTRWAQVMIRFERALYRDPEQDLNGLWWELVSRFQLVSPPEERDSPDWAAKTHVVSAPVYYHNYVLGELLASQLVHHIRRRITPSQAPGDSIFFQRATGTYLRESVFLYGARYRWDKLIEKATGEQLTPKYFVEELNST
jgi:peptidyl-dipeptidase A